MQEHFLLVTAPQLGVNDRTAAILEWYVPDGGKVSIGEPLCSLETSKAVFDVESEMSGYTVHLVDVGSEVAVSQPIALVGPSLEKLEAEKGRYFRRTKRSAAAQGLIGAVRATLKAQDLAERLGVDLSQVPAEGIVREEDVLRYHEGSRQAQRQAPLGLIWDPSRQPVVIYGAGKGAVTLKECLELIGTYEVVCFVDDDAGVAALCQLPVFHSSWLGELYEQGIRNLACEIGNGSVRLRILGECDKIGFDLINVIHPQAAVSPSVRMGKGNYVKAGAVIETGTVIGDCCIIDNGAVIAHDNVIGGGCHIAPGVSMGSSIKVGDLVIIGIGASIATGVQIGRSAIVSVGSSVIKDVMAYAVIDGVPGRVVGRRKQS